MWTAAHRERSKDNGRRYPSDLTDTESETIRPLFAVYTTLTAESVRDGQCLSVSSEDRLRLALPAHGLRPVGDGQDLAHPVQGGRHLGDIAALLTRAVRQGSGRNPEPPTVILASQSVKSGPQAGERMKAAADHSLAVQVSSKPADVAKFTPLPLRWRIEATFGTQTTCYRRLTRNLEQDAPAAENVVELVNFHCVLKAYARQIDCQS